MCVPSSAGHRLPFLTSWWACSSRHTDTAGPDVPTTAACLGITESLRPSTGAWNCQTAARGIGLGLPSALRQGRAVPRANPASTGCLQVGVFNLGLLLKGLLPVKRDTCSVLSRIGFGEAKSNICTYIYLYKHTQRVN